MKRSAVVPIVSLLIANRELLGWKDVHRMSLPLRHDDIMIEVREFSVVRELAAIARAVAWRRMSAQVDHPRKTLNRWCFFVITDDMMRS